MDANVIVNRLITGLIVLRNNIEVIYRYLSVIASHEVNPVMIPPPPFKGIVERSTRRNEAEPKIEVAL